MILVSTIDYAAALSQPSAFTSSVPDVAAIGGEEVEFWNRA